MIKNMTDIRIVIYIFITILLFSNCIGKKNNEKEEKLISFQRINFDDLNKYINKNTKDESYYKDIINNLYNKFEFDSHFDNFILADLDEDGICEIYWRNIVPTGIRCEELYGYNPNTEKIYNLNSEFINGHTGFKLFIYRSELFFIEWDYKVDLKKEIIRIIKILYKPTLKSDKITIENVSENIYNEIIKSKILDKL
jgi:hypothetical protein